MRHATFVGVCLLCVLVCARPAIAQGTQAATERDKTDKVDALGTAARQGDVAITPGASGDITPKGEATTSDGVAWSTKRGGPYIPTPVLHRDALYVCQTLPFVDATRLVVAGCSYGGIQSILAAERGAGFRAALPISPAAQSWAGNPLLRDRLKQAVRKIEMPVLLIQPPQDPSLEPARVLGAEAARAGRTKFTARIYPATMPEAEQTHCFGGARGFHNWADEALSFFAAALK